MKSFVRLALAAGITAGSVDVGMAATATGTMSVKVTITQTCSVSTSPAMTFTSVGGLSTDKDTGTASISVTCSDGLPYKVGLDKGSGASATIASRKMTHTDGVSTINYSLYQDTARTRLFGDGTGGAAELVQATGSGVAQSIPVYGRMFAAPGVTLAAGTYSDTVNITVVY